MVVWQSLPHGDEHGALKALTPPHDTPDYGAEDHASTANHVKHTEDLVMDIVETSDESRPSTPPPAEPLAASKPSSPAHNTRSRKTRSRNVVKAKVKQLLVISQLSCAIPTINFYILSLFRQKLCLVIVIYTENLFISVKIF